LIDADRIAREVVAPGTRGLGKIAEYFGDSMLMKDGTLDRASLRRRILDSERDKEVLESILHPEILFLMKERINGAVEVGHRMVVVEVPLLFELDMASHFDRVVLVKARRDVKIGRLMVRDQVSKADAGRLLDLQMPDDEKEKLSDFVLENDASMENLIKKVDRLIEMLYSGIDDRRDNF
jgi:dephospho-CoA kinase